MSTDRTPLDRILLHCGLKTCAVFVEDTREFRESRLVEWMQDGALNNHCLDPMRGTGRTTIMLAMAVMLACNELDVVVVVVFPTIRQAEYGRGSLAGMLHNSELDKKAHVKARICFVSRHGWVAAIQGMHPSPYVLFDHTNSDLSAEERDYYRGLAKQIRT